MGNQKLGRLSALSKLTELLLSWDLNPGQCESQGPTLGCCILLLSTALVSIRLECASESPGGDSLNMDDCAPVPECVIQGVRD